MRVGRASHRKPEAQGNQRELGEPGGPDGPEGTSGRRKPDAWLPEEPEEEQPAQAGGSTKGRDGGRDARRKPRELADGKPETGSTHAARLSTMKAPEAPASGVFVFGRLPVGIVAKGLCGAPWIFCSGDEDRRSTTVGRMPRMVRAPVPRPRATKAYALRPPVMCGLDQLRESMGRPCRVFWK